MIRNVVAAALLILLCLGTFTVQAQQVQWLSWEQASEMVANGTDKKVFIDVYTDWCGWCKRMDKDTFQNAEVAKYMTDNFLMVKLDGEAKENMDYKGRTFKYVPSGRRGYHELAATLMRGRLSYPTVVFLDEKMNMLSPVPGYQKPEPFLNIARYFGDNIFKEKDWKTYSGQK
ncbi:MAG: DUF255 domain-containing protein [Flavobacteriaceae bacterium]|nr:DUF255 domain-containing protein [Flavobacteriaceae bacterium]